MNNKVVLLAMGNAYCGDDAAGLQLLKYFSQHYQLPAHIKVIEAGANPMAAYSSIAACRWLIILDAIITDAPAGKLTLLDPLQADKAFCQPGKELTLSPHQLGIEDLLLLLTQLGDLPTRLSLIGISIDQYKPGTSTSIAVSRAIPNAATQLADLLKLGSPNKPEALNNA